MGYDFSLVDWTVNSPSFVLFNTAQSEPARLITASLSTFRKYAMASSPSKNQLIPLESRASPSFTDLSQQMQAAMENMLKMIDEIDGNSTGIMEDIEKCKDNALERKRTLVEQKESFQKAAFSVLDMLSNKNI